MARRRPSFGLGFLALCIAIVLWAMAHGSSSHDRGFDVPVVFNGIPDRLVITDQTADAINIRVLGSRAALRNVSASKLEYPIDVSGAKPGQAVYEVDASRIDVPRGTNIVSRSPAILEVKFERRGRKSVRVRPDWEGAPAEGFALGEVVVEPARVWLAGARSEVLRLSEVETETIDITGLSEPTEREVRLSLGGGHVWMEDQGPVTVRIPIEALPPPEEEGEEGAPEAQEGEESGA